MIEQVLETGYITVSSKTIDYRAEVEKPLPHYEARPSI